ncbi:hypothetical protein Kpol_534p51 [Vanderwaltozyma polyspora DSM 70294]|uniref:Adenylate cyclase n=1 Tax=Vanderwaltozyma polyspora (strain ATCC 22028 / DSM 70294 / BCRC 21397 / CBS 2163 / NBRC 10782 / NRRL Y-8283 / UCD 57-17) TaxID=436907 RepID=A7TJM7_VANPO|nr:uncharacterized protein Kpol_534p51 [Vanderwaltozyma polyspora DSM 70294]EDO17570.1 hypothetical protein Kpol_534p51 [Vanderwaltozyma polyspora DSM 70294]
MPDSSSLNSGASISSAGTRRQNTSSSQKNKKKKKKSLSLRRTFSGLSMTALGRSSGPTSGSESGGEPLDDSISLGNPHHHHAPSLFHGSSGASFSHQEHEQEHEQEQDQSSHHQSNRKYSFAENLFKKISPGSSSSVTASSTIPVMEPHLPYQQHYQQHSPTSSIFRKITSSAHSTPMGQSTSTGSNTNASISHKPFSMGPTRYSGTSSDVSGRSTTNQPKPSAKTTLGPTGTSSNANQKKLLESNINSRRSSIISTNLNNYPGLFKLDTNLENLSDITNQRYSSINELDQSSHLVPTLSVSHKSEKQRDQANSLTQWTAPENWDVESSIDNKQLKSSKKSVGRNNSNASSIFYMPGSEHTHQGDKVASQQTVSGGGSTGGTTSSTVSANSSSTDNSGDANVTGTAADLNAPSKRRDSVQPISRVNSKTMLQLQNKLSMTPSNIVPHPQHNADTQSNHTSSTTNSGEAGYYENDNITINSDEKRVAGDKDLEYSFSNDSIDSYDIIDDGNYEYDGNIGNDIYNDDPDLEQYRPAHEKVDRHNSDTNLKALKYSNKTKTTIIEDHDLSMNDDSNQTSNNFASIFSKDDELHDRAEYELEKYYKDVSDLDPNKHYAIRIFNTDDTFTTLSCTPNTTVQEMIPTLRKKFNISIQGNFQVSLKVGKLSKFLKPLSKPILIERRLLLLIGYKKTDPLHIMGIADLSFVFKFHFHPVAPSHLTAEQEQRLMRSDFVHVDLRRLNLTTPPIIFYQHTTEIESLDVSNNANIFLPLEFIESAINLSSLRMVNIRASRFPSNITEAYKLVSLELQRNFIKKVPNSIAALTNLTILNLQCNCLKKLPKGFGKLKNLQLLDLSSNYFVEYPEVINNCTNILQIDLSYNKIVSIPSSINQLVKLAKMNLSHNKLTNINDLSGMKNLRTLNIRHNRITTIKTNASNLQNLFLTNNRISTFDDKLPKLRALEIPGNPITSIPYQDFFPLNMTSLSLNKAKLSSIPGELFVKLARLEKLDISENNLTQIPSQISMLNKLIYLSIARNKIESLPKEFSKLTNLKTLDLHSNNIRDLVNGAENIELTYLNLSSNAFGNQAINGGEFFTKLSPSSKLAKTLMFFIAADNQFDDSSWTRFNCFKNLKVLNLSYNNFTDISNLELENLTELYFSGNKLISLPSDTILRWKYLKTLMLNGNQLLSLPSEVSKLSQLTVFDIGSNQLKYNISNHHYEWNWKDNKELRYLNFSGNRRFEIKSSASNDHDKDFADFTVLPQLKVLGLMDVTLNTTKVPDENFNFRLRTSGSVINGMMYGVADTLGQRNYVSSRDVTFERFRSKDDECLLCLHDSKNQSADYGHNIAKIVRDIYHKILRRQLEKYGEDDDGIKNALRFSFLQLNKEINTMLNSVDNGAKVLNLTSVDLLSGACSTVVYIKGKKIYTANIGDCMAILLKNNSDYQLLTNLHVPYKREEYERIRVSGGYVNNDKLDGGVDVSRAVGFFHLLPHIHASPDISVVKLTKADEILVIATHKLWEYMDYETACDIAREHIGNPMRAAEEMKDHAIAYGCSENITILCLSLQNNYEQQGKFNLNKNSLITRRATFEDATLRRLQPEIAPPTGNLAIVFTDIKNSTFLWELFPNAMRTAIKTHNDIMRRQLRIYGGYEVKTEGDAFMVAFPTPIRSLVWCLNVQLKLLDAKWPEEITSIQDGGLITDKHGMKIYQGLSVRMGIHWGLPVPELDLVTQRMDYLGPVVNKAARVSSIADGGQIALSNDFCAEFNKVMGYHEKVIKDNEPLERAYGEEFIGEILEREISLLENIGWVFYEYGERKLKGLESKEYITIAYPKSLASRHEFFGEEEENASIDAEILFRLRTASNRLDSILSAVRGGFIEKDQRKQNEGGGFISLNSQVQDAVMTSINEMDIISFLDHLVTRVESTVAMLVIHQKIGNKLDIVQSVEGQLGVFELLDKMLESDKYKTLEAPK